MTTPTQTLNTSQHNSKKNEEDLLNSRNQHPNDNDIDTTITVHTDSTTVPAANPPRRVTVSARLL
jgi:hypothetical protein